MPKKQKLSLLDCRLGRIEVVVRDWALLERLWPGMELGYVLQEGRSVHVVSQVTLHAMPEARARRDITFLHHILELCYHFLPVADAEPHIFELVALVCADNLVLTQIQKIMILAKFFWLIGLEIDMLQGQDAVQDLLALPLRSMLREHMNDGVQKHLLMWMRRCIVSHPQHTNFKTMSFLTGTGVL